MTLGTALLWALIGAADGSDRSFSVSASDDRAAVTIEVRLGAGIFRKKVLEQWFEARKRRVLACAAPQSQARALEMTVTVNGLGVTSPTVWTRGDDGKRIWLRDAGTDPVPDCVVAALSTKERSERLPPAGRLVLEVLVTFSGAVKDRTDAGTP